MGGHRGAEKAHFQPAPAKRSLIHSFSRILTSPSAKDLDTILHWKCTKENNRRKCRIKSDTNRNAKALQNVLKESV